MMKQTDQPSKALEWRVIWNVRGYHGTHQKSASVWFWSIRIRSLRGSALNLSQPACLLHHHPKGPRDMPMDFCHGKKMLTGSIRLMTDLNESMIEWFGGKPR
jgi:hypothetical protein